MGGRGSEVMPGPFIAVGQQLHDTDTVKFDKFKNSFIFFLPRTPILNETFGTPCGTPTDERKTIPSTLALYALHVSAPFPQVNYSANPYSLHPCGAT